MDLSKLREKLLAGAIGRAALRAVEFFYALGVKLNNYAFDKGWRPSRAVNTRVVCIGNITAGGTGKTTAVLLAAAQLARAGVRTAIVSRGYKRSGSKKGEITVIFDNARPDWRQTGDEPYMMASLLAPYKVPVLVSADRYAAANEALRRFKSQVVLLDDGFQHRRLRRDADIILIDAKNPFGGGRLLPFGTLREPASALKRAALAIITHSDLTPARRVEDIKDQIRLINEDIEILCAVHKPDYFFDLAAQARVELADLKGAAAVFSAIGEPESFEQTLRNIGIDIKRAWRFADHASYTLDDMRNFEALRGGLPLITTFKDAVKLPEGWQDAVKGRLYILAVNMEIADGALPAFMEALYPGAGKNK
ncbi:MAG: tetraacyldisaccharide 4'-kinase [Elusimicrobiota bacterium]|jgi:tetraacyldisaccharide 4'-kinase|nr:tetraacyldisaccharide 4'-kinase [Elusimicrobiota bacterium]